MTGETEIDQSCYTEALPVSVLALAPTPVTAGHGPRNCLRLICNEVWSDGPFCREKWFADKYFFGFVTETDGADMVESEKDRWVATNTITPQCKQKWSGAIHRTLKKHWTCKHPEDKCNFGWWYKDYFQGNYAITASNCSMPFDHGVGCSLNT